MSSLSNLNVLLLDDDPSIAAVFCEMTELLGCQVKVITDPRKFKKTYLEMKPDVVMLDVVMPAIDGIELAQWVAKSESPADILIISGFNSLYSSAAIDVVKAHGNASVQALKKPLNLSVLECALESFQVNS